MTMLWLIFMLLILVSLAILLAPFVKGAENEEVPRIDYDIVVYRNQLAEIDQEIERGLLTQDEAEAARAEVHRRMLAAEDAELASRTAPIGVEGRRLRLAAVIAIAVVLPVGATALYGALGSPGVLGKPYAWRQTHDPEFVTASTADKLAHLLQASPTAAGYRRLAQMYFETRNYDQAADADRKAVELGATDAATWSELGESVVMSNGGAIVPEALLAFTNSLAVDPSNSRSRFYIGLAESQIGNLKRAVSIWRDLEAHSEPNASWLPLVREHIAAVSKDGHFDPASVPPEPPDAKAMSVALTAMTNAMHVQGSAGVPGQPAGTPAATAPPSAAPNDKDTMIHAMVDRFAAKMDKDSANVAGWQRLAHAYVVLGEIDKAQQAIDRAVKLKPSDAGVLVSLAEVQKATAAPGDIAPDDVTATMRKVLKLDPENVPALYVVGLSEKKAGHTAQARTLWKKALAKAPPDDAAATEIKKQLDAIGSATD
jgi:cytochrome c-type biogenesis protein CcmH